jgi:hypothetical protein
MGMMLPRNGKNTSSGRPPNELAVFGGLSSSGQLWPGMGRRRRNIGGLRSIQIKLRNRFSKQNLRNVASAPNRRPPAKHIGGLGGLASKWPQLSPIDRQLRALAIYGDL